MLMQEEGPLFVGRVQEYSWIQTRLSRRGAGSCMLMVSGPPGVGKTRLVREALANTPHHWAKTWEFGEAPGLWPVAQLLRRLRSRTPLAFEEDREVLATLLEGRPSSYGPFALYQTVIQSVVRASLEEPVIAVIDDIHAADRSTLELLLMAEAEWRNAPIMLLMTRRTVDARTSPEAQQCLARLLQLSEDCVLRGLSCNEVKEFASYLASRNVSSEEVQTLLQRTGGLPLFVEGLMHNAHGARVLPSKECGGLPPSLRAVIVDRMDRLPSRLKHVMQRAALMRDEIEPALLAQSLQVPLTQVEVAVRQAIAEGLLRREESGVYWTHQLYAEALVTEQEAEQVRRGHLELLEALELGGSASTLSLAEHALAGGHPEAARLVRAAGEEAESVYAFKAAADLYGRASTLLEQPVERCDAMIARARSLIRAGERQAAKKALEAAQRFNIESCLPAIACAYADMGSFAIGDQQTVTLLRQSLDEVEPDNHRVRSAVLARLVTQELELDPEREHLTQLLQESLDAANQTQDARSQLEAIVASLRYWRADRLEERAQLVSELEALRAKLTHPRDHLELARWSFNTALERCDGFAVRKALHGYERAAALLRTPQEAFNVAIRKTIVLQLEGRYDEVDGDSLLALGQQAEDPHAAYFSVSCRVYSAALRGKKEQLKEWLPLVQHGSSFWQQHHGVMLHSSWLQLQLGEVAPVDAAYQVWRATQFRRTPWWSYLQGLAILADIALARKWEDDAAILVERLAEYPEGYAGCGPTLPFGPLARFEAKLQRFLGRTQEAAIATERAMMLCDRLGAPGSATLIREEQEVTQVAVTARPTQTQMIYEGDTWLFVDGSFQHRLKTAKGWTYISAILSREGESVHVLELTSGAYRQQVDGDAGEILDEQARRVYAQRALELRQEIAEAEDHHDLGRLDVLQAEFEQLTEELAYATGLGGRNRRAASNAQRARTSVKQAIRRAIASLKDPMPELALHLEQYLKTGMLCCYTPPKGMKVVVKDTQ